MSKFSGGLLKHLITNRMSCSSNQYIVGRRFVWISLVWVVVWFNDCTCCFDVSTVKRVFQVNLLVSYSSLYEVGEGVARLSIFSLGYLTVRSSSTQSSSKMGLPLAENGIFPSFTAPEVGVTPQICALCADLTPRASRSIVGTPVSWIRHCDSIRTICIIETKKHLQCETLLGLARESTKKRRNKKFGECITTIRYNVIHMYCFWKLMLWCFLANPFTL